jgi:hypothetical protein
VDIPVAQEPRQSVPGRIDEAQRRAEERAKNNWFVNQWNDLVEMVSSPGFWAGLITGLILGAIVVALVIGGVLTGGVAIVAAAALVGAIAAGVGTAVGNHAEGKPWHEGIVSNMIFGAVGGAAGAAALLILGGVAAGAGLSAGATLALLTAGASVIAGIVTIIDNVAHDRPWDKGLLANMALAGILTWVGGKIEGRFRGRASGGSKQYTPEQKITEQQQAPRTLTRGRAPVGEELPGSKPEPEPSGKKPPGKKPPGNRLPRTTELPPEELSRLVSERSDGTFRLNRKNVNNLDKIVGESEAKVAEHAAREAYASERAANMNNVERVYMGTEADRLINPDVAPGTDVSADVVGVTRQGRYVLIESKGTEILHGLEQLDYSANALGREQVVRYELVVPEEIRTPGFTIQNGTLHLNGQPYLINGKPVHVRTTTQGR